MSQNLVKKNCDPLLILRAKAELRLREMRRESPRKLTYYEWLKETTPKFNWDWPHLVYVRERIDCVLNGTLKRLMIFMPPRHGKSSIGTMRLPAYILENDPSARIISLAYNQTLAEKFSRQTRRIAQTRIQLSTERTAVSDWETPQGGGLRSVGVGGGITGMGADYFFIDDPIKNREEANSQVYREKVWDCYKDDIYTRLEPGASIILIMTRWHEDDLAGRILASEDGPNWEVVNLPAFAESNDALGREIGQPLCPERYDTPRLLELQSVMGASFQALFQQRPSAIEGEIFKREFWPYYKQCSPYKMIVQSIDTAFKTKKENDFSVIHTYGLTDTKFQLIDRWKAKVEFPDLKRAVIAKAAEFAPNEILIEDKASGQSLIQELRRGTNLPIIAIKVDTDKISRAHASIGSIEAGRLELPESAPWLLDYIDTLAVFPNGVHDDDVDATTQFLSRHGFKPQKDYWVM